MTSILSGPPSSASGTLVNSMKGPSVDDRLRQPPKAMQQMNSTIALLQERSVRAICSGCDFNSLVLSENRSLVGASLFEFTQRDAPLVAIVMRLGAPKSC